MSYAYVKDTVNAKTELQKIITKSDEEDKKTMPSNYWIK